MAQVVQDAEQVRKTPVFTSDAQRESFDREQGAEVLKDYFARDKMQRPDIEEQTDSVLDGVLPIHGAVTPAPEPGAGQKARISRSLKRRFHLKNRRHLDQNATEYTDSILKYEEKLKKDRDTGRIKPPDTSDGALWRLRDTIAEKHYNAGKFTRDYLGEHYAEVKAEMEELGRFLEYFGEGTERYQRMDHAEMAWVRNLAMIHTAMEAAMTDALAMHGIKKDGDRYVITDQADHHANNTTASIQDLRDHIAQAELEEIVNRSMEAGNAETEEQQQQWLREFPEIQDRFGFVKLSDRAGYETVSGLLKLQGEAGNAGRCRENRELIGKILMDILRMGEADAWHARQIAAWEETRGALEGFGPRDLHMENAPQNEWTRTRDAARLGIRNRIRLETYRRQAYRQRIDALIAGANCLITGQREGMTGEAVRTLAAYGSKEAGQEAGLDAQNEPDVLRENERLFQEACERYSQTHDDIDEMSEFLRTKAVNYMRSGDEKYNDRIVTFTVRRSKYSKRKKEDQVYRRSEESRNEGQALAKEAVALLAPYVRVIEECNLSSFTMLPPDKLLSGQTELRKLRMLGDMFADFGALKVFHVYNEQLFEKPPEQADGESVNDVDEERYNARIQAFDVKIKLIRSTHKRARAVALLAEAVRKDDKDPLPLLLTETERKQLERDLGKLEKRFKHPARSSRDKLRLFAMDLYAKGLEEEGAAMADLFDTDNAVYEHLSEDHERREKEELVQSTDGYLSPEHPLLLGAQAQGQERRAYYDTLRAHYEMVEKKYGHELPDLPTLMMNRHEMLTDLNAGPSPEQLENDTEVLDRQTSEDLRLLHLVRYYRHFRDCIADIIPDLILNDTTQRGQVAQYRELAHRLYAAAGEHMAEVSRDLDYLITHPQKGGAA